MPIRGTTYSRSGITWSRSFPGPGCRSRLLLPWLVPAWWRRLKAGDAATWLLLGWAGCVLVFFSLTPGKRGVYILPALPAVVLAAAPLVVELIARRGVQRLAVLVLAGLAIVAAAAVAWGFDLWPVALAGAVLAAALTLASRRIGAVLALALFIIGSWQLYGWWAAPMMNPMRSGSELMARVKRTLPAGAELGLAGWKEQLLLHVDRPVFHFGFRRASADETRDAAAWLAQDANRRLLIPQDQMAPCLDPQAGEELGSRHRKEWRLVGRRRSPGACPDRCGSLGCATTTRAAALCYRRVRASQSPPPIRQAPLSRETRRTRLRDSSTPARPISTA